MQIIMERPNDENTKMFQDHPLQDALRSKLKGHA